MQINLIKGIKFTNRELDVISCVICGRTYKSMALLLSLSQNTINTHIKKILIKIDGSCQDHIIRFVENSAYYQFLQKRYLDILTENDLVEFLKIMANSVSLKTATVVSVGENKPIVDTLLRFLNALEVGVNVEYVHSLQNFCYQHGVNYTFLIFENIPEPHKILKNKNITILSMSNYNTLNYTNKFLDVIKRYAEDKKAIDNFVEKTNIRYELYKEKSLPPLKNVDKKQWFSRCFLCLFIVILFGFSYFYVAGIKNSTEISNIQQIDETLFLQRDFVLKSIDTSFSKQTGNVKMVVLYGPGGIGKTTLARHYLKQKHCDVTWEICAENKNSLIASFKTLAKKLAESKSEKDNLSIIESSQNSDITDSRIVEFVYKCLDDKKNWYLLLDNVENFPELNVVFQTKFGSKCCGKILITTRDTEYLKKVNTLNNTIVSIPELTSKEKISLFSKILYTGANCISVNHQQRTFIDEIPPYPLDILSAASYIKNTNTSLNDYVLSLKNNSKYFDDLSKHFIQNTTNYDKTRYMILSSTFDELLKINPVFKELLIFICLLDSQNIPIRYLKRLYDPAIVDNFIYQLKKNCIITNMNEGLFNIHRSIQVIGIRYFDEKITHNELDTYIRNIVKTLTPYRNLIWTLYPSQESKMHAKERKELLPHLESIYSKLGDNFEEHKLKILVALAYAYEDVKNYVYIKNVLDQIISKNNKRAYITGEDLICFLLYTVYASFNINKGSFVKSELLKCLKLCGNSEKFYHQKSICFSYLARYYFEKKMERIALKYLSDSLILQSKIKSSNKLAATAINANQYCKSIVSYFINKNESLKAIEILSQIVNEICGNEYFFKTKKYLENVPLHLSELRLNQARAYNKVGNYVKALDCEKEVKFLYEQLALKGVNLVLRQIELDTEYGLTILRMGKIYEAQIKLRENIKNLSKIQKTKELSLTMVYLSEANIRVNNNDEAYKHCRTARSFFHKEEDNYTKLMENICIYNMAIICCKKSNTQHALSYFDEFFEHANKFCAGFLDKLVYEQLELERVFEKTQGLQKCHDNCLKIFTAIYGPEHSFVKDYVAENCKNRSFLYDCIIIACRYVRYYFDRFIALF